MGGKDIKSKKPDAYHFLSHQQQTSSQLNWNWDRNDRRTLTLTSYSLLEVSTNWQIKLYLLFRPHSSSWCSSCWWWWFHLIIVIEKVIRVAKIENQMRKRVNCSVNCLFVWSFESRFLQKFLILVCYARVTCKQMTSSPQMPSTRSTLSQQSCKSREGTSSRMVSSSSSKWVRTLQMTGKSPKWLELESEKTSGARIHFEGLLR